jgi:hypothetical protein
VKLDLPARSVVEPAVDETRNLVLIRTGRGWRQVVRGARGKQ